jgi:HlyD family secretion protein
LGNLYNKLLLVALLLLNFAVASCRKAPEPEVVSGTIETDEVRVASRYGGRVEKISAQEGDTLKAGQVIAELEASELHARRAQVAAQLAELESGPRKEEIAAAKNDWEALVAELQFAQADQKRVEELFRQNTIPESERDRTATRARSLDKNVAAAKSRYELLLAGTRHERIDQARAQLAEIDTQLGEMRIVAPGDSVLEVLSVKVGDVLSPNREVATLLLPEHIWVRVYVPEPWLGRIKMGDAATVHVDAFPGRDFRGTVEQIGRAAEFTPRNVQTVAERVKQVFPIKVRLDPKDPLRAGMGADVAFPNSK